MKNKNEKSRRCAIYVITNQDDVLDDYQLYQLKEIKKVAHFTLLVCNLQLAEKNEMELKKYADFILSEYEKITIQKHYIKALLYLKKATAFSYEEVILADDSVFGPIFSLELIFKTMETNPSDFWSMTQSLKEKTFYPDTYFMVFRQNIIEDLCLVEYLKQSIKESDSLDTFLGIIRNKYQGTTGIFTDDFLKLTNQPLRRLPYFLVKNKHCPFILEDAFYDDYSDTFAHDNGAQTKKVLFFIQKHTDYDTQLIWQRVLRIGNMADVKRQLQLNYVLSSTVSKKSASEKLRIALVLHIYYSELAEYCRSYAESMPEGTDVYITVPDEKKLEIVRKAFENFALNIKFRITGNVGRDVGPFIVGCKDIIDQYDLICKVHDKKVYQVKPMSIGESWSDKCFENLLKNKVLVENVIHTFCENPHLGMLMPPVPMHGPYYPTVGFGEWSVNYKKTKELYDMLELHVPICEEKEPIAPLGSMFWFRTKALKSLFSHDWDYSELPEEPIPVDQTILHAIERLYPFCVQESGYYSAWLMADSYARIEIDNLHYMNGELRREEFKKVGIQKFQELINGMKEY